MPTPVGLDLVEEGDREDMCRTLFYSLRRHLSQEQVALLWLRHGEDMTPRQISVYTGVDNRTISRRLYRATSAAREFLGTLGMKQWEDVLECRPEDLTDDE